MTSFNAFGTSEKAIGKTSKPVWLGVVAPHAVGGVLAANYRIAGLHLPAGTPVNLSAGVIKPLFPTTVKVIESGSPAAVTGVTVDPATLGITPAVGDKVQLVGNNTTAVAITAIAANGSDASLLDLTVALTDAQDDDLVAIIPAAESAYAAPNGYLYNDIYLGDLSQPNATGAVVDFHGEGLLIDFTPAAAVKALMKANVPNVVQVEFPNDAFYQEA